MMTTMTTGEDLIGRTVEIHGMRRRMSDGGATISVIANATVIEATVTRKLALDVTTMTMTTNHAKCDASNTKLTTVIPCRTVATARGRGKGSLSL